MSLKTETQFEPEESRFISPATASVVESKDGEETRTIEGMAFKYNEWSSTMRGLLNGKPILFRERILPGAADEADMTDVIARSEHSNHSILARRKEGKGTLHLELRAEGLYYRFVAPNTTAGNDAYENIRLGNVDGSSFAFNVAEKGATLKKGQDGIYERDISKMSIIGDVAPVAKPAYKSTSVIARSSSSVDFLEELEKEETRENPEPSRLKLRKAQVALIKVKNQN
ncbi:HK97 family phage prohead protease [Roseivirga pacifica]|uniref:HK97 family phage prohead protease n=1 Tax=Roseivirga pacifica TaxID=1267423 RepID=UPI002096058C|nr:HK97 family phage prohead protease [Roseivirga pacifica]MCO6358555.1 HK97 family phage prohead protease [Roseivirga pacifica]MCO6369110.1 HK97 family phage prohead protease [Roseivirga pacifica]MCO6372186.1 HK97 family phage prohead protease [Roseivirga pacifica]MCO6374286.1 HK97 family phage prohead protease [Roseivirga pacifica]MCO6380917.1 HK97 family phage prohead protease [Roseivirga pacifica]